VDDSPDKLVGGGILLLNLYFFHSSQLARWHLSIVLSAHSLFNRATFVWSTSSREIRVISHC
jgi:hypothetical protein